MINPPASADLLRFLQGGGQMGERIRNNDWSRTPLGPPETWPAALQSALSICLNAGFPIAIYWGPELTLLYNDAWSFIPGDKHPWALGKPGAAVWSDIWDTVGPQFDSIFREGGSVRSIDVLLPMQRYGYVEETYFDYNLSPIFVADGTVGGVFNAGIETTYRIVNERRNQMLHILLDTLSVSRTVDDTWSACATVLASARAEIPFYALFRLDAAGMPQAAHFSGISAAALATGSWPFVAAAASGKAVPADVSGLAIRSFWPEYCTEALLLPLRAGNDPVVGFLLAGLSARKRLDDGYRQLIDTVALHMSTALTRSAAQAREVIVRRQLEESEDNLRRLLLQAPVGICILQGEEMIVEIANDVYLELVQRPRNTFEGRPVWEGLPEVRDQGFDVILSNVLHSGERFVGRDVPVQLIRNGIEETIYVDFVYEPMRGRNGVPDRIMALVIDVTEKVLARRAIEVSEERARLAIASAELGTFDVDLRTNEIIASPRMAEIMGVAYGEPRQRFVDAIHPEDLAVRTSAYLRAYETGVLRYEGRVVWPDGSVHWIRVQGRVYYDDDHKPRQLLGVVQDITEVKQFAEELARQVEERTQALQQANEELGRRNDELEQFAYVSSHDLQEPLRKIRMFSDLIREQDSASLSPASLVRFEKVTAAAERMSRSLRDLLEYASLGRRDFWEEVDLNEVVRQVCVDLELLITQKGADVHADKLPLVRAIPLQMHQLFYNLINNALKFAREDIPAQVTITCSSVERAWQIVVADNGIGFDQQNALRIFTIFQRLHDRQSYGGSGIGLALCKKVVENHGGTIRAEGALGEGARFIIQLPC